MRQTQIIDVEKKFIKEGMPLLTIGDTVKVLYKIKEGDKERVQPFEGILIRKRGAGNNATITVRKISYGLGVERIFPVNSPNIQDIKILRQGKVRRAKLYYLRDRKGKSAKLKEIRHKKVKKRA